MISIYPIDFRPGVILIASPLGSSFVSRIFVTRVTFCQVEIIEENNVKNGPDLLGDKEVFIQPPVGVSTRSTPPSGFLK